MSTVEFREVGKRFGDGPLILDRITLASEPGDFISIIGPSGCGKSTLLRLVAGLSPVSTGALTFGGRPPGSAATEVAFVFQEPTLLPWLTVDDNVELPARLRRLPPGERAERRRKAVALAGLDDRASFYPRQLSGGQKMRVSLARALTLSPGVLLLDEPFGALDEMTRERLNEELLAIQREQRWTAFFVTHSVAEAVFLSNRIVVLAPKPGRIHSEVRVDLPYPRTAETRFSRDYQDLVAGTSRLLRSVAASH
ncbi:MAG TPA: ABC transporter ATP-binding protein [Opitutaceae bacterium]|nr:ABC transporter ATP-binding protein [Opitutaceae bacterium]